VLELADVDHGAPRGLAGGRRSRSDVDPGRCSNSARPSGRLVLADVTSGSLRGLSGRLVLELADVDHGAPRGLADGRRSGSDVAAFG
jgi:hypothetical protein